MLDNLVSMLAVQNDLEIIDFEVFFFSTSKAFSCEEKSFEKVSFLTFVT